MNKSKKYTQLISSLKNSNGAVAIIVAALLVVLVGITALAVDVGLVAVAKNQLQNATDAASLAATRCMSHICYNEISPLEHESVRITDKMKEEIIGVANNVANQNKVAGKGVTITEKELTIGVWDPEDKIFTPSDEQPTGIKIEVLMEGDNAISTFFGRIFNIDSVAVNAHSTAVLTPQRTFGDPPPPVTTIVSSIRTFFARILGTDAVAVAENHNISSLAPFGIHKCFLNTSQSQFPFFDVSLEIGTKESKAWWHTYTDTGVQDIKGIKDMLDKLINQEYPIPGVVAGKTEFTLVSTETERSILNNDENVMEDVKKLFGAMKGIGDSDHPDTLLIDGDSDPDTWTTTAPIYDDPDYCGQGGSEQGPCNKTVVPIVGFATIKIRNVDVDNLFIDIQVIRSTNVGRGLGENPYKLGYIPPPGNPTDGNPTDRYKTYKIGGTGQGPRVGNIPSLVE